MSSTSLTIERYAEIRADMDAGKLRDEALTYAGIDVDTWTNEQQTWLEKMGTELERGRFELTNRYTRAFTERLRALDEGARVRPAVGASAAKIDSSLLVGAESSSLSKSSVNQLGTKPTESNQYESYALEPASSASMPIAPYVAPSQPSSLEMTLPPITRSPVSKATPFNAITKPSFTLSDVLPPEILAQPKAPATVQVEEPWRDDDSDAAERTIFGAYSNGPALPFQAGEHDGRDPIKVSAPPSASNATNPSDNDSAGMTMFAFSAAPPSSVLPFQSKSLPSADAKAWAEMVEQVEFPTLSRSLVQKTRELTSTESDLNAYASLCAELAAAPTDAEATFARYGLVLPEKRKAVDDAWKERLRRDPALYTQWQQFYRAAFERLKR